MKKQDIKLKNRTVLFKIGSMVTLHARLVCNVCGGYWMRDGGTRKIVISALCRDGVVGHHYEKSRNLAVKFQGEHICAGTKTIFFIFMTGVGVRVKYRWSPRVALVPNTVMYELIVIVRRGAETYTLQVERLFRLTKK